MGNKLLKIKAVSRKLDCSTRTVYKLVKAGRLPVIRLGEGPKAPIRIADEAVDAWLKSNTTQPEEPAA